MDLNHRQDAVPVLIAGAGPVGLALACDLRLQGVDVRIVDVDREPSAHSRANVIWPGNLTLLSRIGVTAPLLAAGHRMSGVAYYSNRRRLATASLAKLSGAEFPFALMIPQSSTESVLTDRLAELGGKVERGVRVAAMDTTGGRPLVRVEHPDGTSEQIRAEWLVGADGAHSTVRAELRIEFGTEPMDVSFAIADAPISGGLAESLSYYCYSDRGGMALAPLGGGLFRLAMNARPGDHGVPYPASAFQSALDERAPGDLRVGDLLWSTTFAVRTGIADRMRSGRCLLAGDAAHIVSPAGGQGMNTGLQDAISLGWRLGGVVRGTLAEKVLDDYDTERRSAAHRVARTTAVQTRFAIAGTDRRKLLVRDTLAKAAGLSGLVQRYLAPMISQVDAATRLPVALSPESIAGWPVVAADGLTVLLWPGARTPRGWSGTCAEVSSALSDLRVLELTGAEPRPLAAALGRRPVAALVRPDGHLAAKVDPNAPDIAAAVRSAGVNLS